MNLTAHFTLDEMIRSEWAIRNGVLNVPSLEAISYLRMLCIYILEPLRFELGRPITITSGFRNPEVNKAIGGSPNSQHTLGQAADFVVEGRGNLGVIKQIHSLDLPVDQVIYEFGERGWVHVSYVTIGRKEFLEAYSENGKTLYRPLRP